jgi:hypothetical protein
MGARNRVGIGLSYRFARLLAEFIPWNRFLGSINVKKYGLSTDRQTGWKIDRQIDGQTDRTAERQTYREERYRKIDNRQTDRETDRKTDRENVRQSE